MGAGWGWVRDGNVTYTGEERTNICLHILFDGSYGNVLRRMKNGHNSRQV